MELGEKHQIAVTVNDTTQPFLQLFSISPTLKRCSAKLAAYRPVILHPPPAVSRYYRALLPPLFYHFAGQRSFLATDVISQALPPQQPHLASCRLDFVWREETGLKTALKTHTQRERGREETKQNPTSSEIRAGPTPPQPERAHQQFSRPLSRALPQTSLPPLSSPDRRPSFRLAGSWQLSRAIIRSPHLLAGISKSVLPRGALSRRYVSTSPLTPPTPHTSSLPACQLHLFVCRPALPEKALTGDQVSVSSARRPRINCFAQSNRTPCVILPKLSSRRERC